MTDKPEDNVSKIESIRLLALLKALAERRESKDSPLDVWNVERVLFAGYYSDSKQMRAFLEKYAPNEEEDEKVSTFKFIGMKYIIWPTVHNAIVEGDVKTLEAILRYPVISQLFKKDGGNNLILEEIDDEFLTADHRNILLFLMRKRPLATHPLSPYLSSENSVAVFNVLANYGVLKRHESMLCFLSSDSNGILNGLFTRENILSLLSHFEHKGKISMKLYVDLYRRAPPGCLPPWSVYCKEMAALRPK